MSALDRAKILTHTKNMVDLTNADNPFEQGLRLFFTPGRYRPRPDEAAIIERARHIQVANGLAAYEWGSGKRTVLLLHGWSGAASQLTAVVDPLVRHGYRVIALDAPAHGASPGSQTMLIDIVRCLDALTQELGPFSAAIGHSLGASALIHAVGIGVMKLEKLVLVAGPGNVPDVFERFARAMGFSGEAKDQFLRVLKAKVEVPPESIYDASWRLTPESLVLHDENDMDIPCTEAATVAGFFTHAQVHITKGLGHRRIIRTPRVVAHMAAFLGGTLHDNT